MALVKIKDFDANYRDTFGGYDIKGIDVYSDINNEKIGTVNDLLVDEQGHFRYFIVDLGFWGFGKKVLLPVGRSEIDNDGKHVRAIGFTKEQAEHLPEFNESLKIDHQYEDRVRGVYRSAPQDIHVRPLEASAPLEGAHHVARSAAPPTPPVPPVAPVVPPAPQPVPTAHQVIPPQQVPVQPQQVPASYGYPQQAYPQPPQPSYPAAPQPPLANQGGYPPVADPNAPYGYQQDPYLYGMNEQHHSVLQRYQERLIAKKRQSGQLR
ncbi:MAG TPA: PRC-barrel domain-containing protein [Crinalium sp.]|jgi:stress response protein YsnF